MTTLIVAGPLVAFANEQLLTLSREKTSVIFTVKATGHTIEGTLALDSAHIRFDPDTGAASGEVTLDLRRAGTGNSLRDREMRGSVLEAERYPLAIFRPSRLTGSLAPTGVSELVLSGIVTMHGGEHALSLPVRAAVAGSTVSAETAFEIPYVAWGLRDPSLLFLRVSPVVGVSVRTEARLEVVGKAP